MIDSCGTVHSEYTYTFTRSARLNTSSTLSIVCKVVWCVSVYDLNAKLIKQLKLYYDWHIQLARYISGSRIGAKVSGLNLRSDKDYRCLLLLLLWFSFLEQNQYDVL